MADVGPDEADVAPSMADQRPERKANFQAQTFGKVTPLVELKLMVEFIKRLKERLEKTVEQWPGKAMS